ncbi:MAG: P1 family peptidase [Candidatus Tectomicrobia bacterium]|uniref:P1 family peptidase n=1 Tax=Tectimicrobiota bacterium TaxID=2528274 RepID=A0A933GM24_UNCTE|nr:P1 family peptidase [Candidatus Tectomicrobia bacterium]
MFNSITDIPGIAVGHASDFQAFTGCTVVLFQNKTTGGIDARGTASGTRGIDSLNGFHLVEEVHGLILSGGSAFGLDAAGGVMKYLEEKGSGFDVAVTKVPIVPSAIIFDLSFGDWKKRPDKEMGYQACLNAKIGPVEEGSVGAGTGATVGKLYGAERATKGGLGTSGASLSDGLKVGALVVVNAFGDVVDPQTGQVMAGTRDSKNGSKFVDTKLLMREGAARNKKFVENTTLAIAVTNAKLRREELKKIAQIGHNAFARCISPAHSTFDGDVVFALSTGEMEADLNSVAILVEDVIVSAIINGIKKADGFGLLPSYSQLRG